MASKHPDPCTFCGHALKAHRRGYNDPKHRFVCECGCAIEFERDEED